MINVEIVKTGSENALAVIRRFTRRVQGTGIVRTVRGGRYFARSTSQSVKKKQALKRNKRREDRLQLIKEGKISETPVRRGGTHHREQQSVPTQLGGGSTTIR
jgi:ribosomal protein S21